MPPAAGGVGTGPDQPRNDVVGGAGRSTHPRVELGRSRH
jgi:hypothetical protein